MGAGFAFAKCEVVTLGLNGAEYPALKRVAIEDIRQVDNLVTGTHPVVHR
jgi:hypothetical protein